MGKRGFREDAFQRFLIIDQQIARAGADEDLDARRALSRLQLAEIVRRGADVEAVIDQ